VADRDEPDDLLAAAAAALREAPVPRPEPLVVAAAALREVSLAAPADVAATRRRVMASLERRGHGHRRRVVVAAVLGLIGTGTLSWAASTGRVQRVLAAIARPAFTAPAPAPAPAIAIASEPAHRAATRVEPAAVVEPAAPVIVARPAHRAAIHEPRTAPPPIDDPVDRELYARAHAAHFRGADPALALAAWDTYLAERPAGRFAIEARYNRALVLIRLDRVDEARAALAPFADGEVAPTGYRQHDARGLLDALDRAGPR